ncbi:MAG: aquaporin [Nostocoides sp.]
MAGNRSVASLAPWLEDFDAPGHQWRRLVAEVVGTFFLVAAGAGGEAVAAVVGGEPTRAARALAPGLTVMAFILATGAVSGAHFNPAVTVGFAWRHDFPWRRVPGYVLAQLAGAGLACLVVHAAVPGADAPLAVASHHLAAAQTLGLETVLTVGLVTVILGTASSAQNVGHLSAVAVGGYIALAGLWSGPLTGAVMNPARALGSLVLGAAPPDLWAFVLAPFLGAAMAVGLAWVLRGPGGGDHTARSAAEGRT